MNISAEKEFLYLMRFMDDYIENTLYCVLEDSAEQPEYSAVTVNNLIKCYIKVLTDCGIKCNYSTVHDYLVEKWFSSDEIELFEQRRKAESLYYIGEQF